MKFRLKKMVVPFLGPFSSIVPQNFVDLSQVRELLNVEKYISWVVFGGLVCPSEFSEDDPCLTFLLVSFSNLEFYPWNRQSAIFKPFLFHHFLFSTSSNSSPILYIASAFLTPCLPTLDSLTFLHFNQFFASFFPRESFNQLVWFPYSERRYLKEIPFLNPLNFSVNQKADSPL